MQKATICPDRGTLLRHFEDAGHTLRWVLPTSRGIRKGQLAESVDTSGYYRVTLNGRIYRVHNLLWIIRNGEIPAGHIVDHRDGNRLNNQDDNHRLATRQQNAQNANMPARNTSGVKGVRWEASRARWRAEIRSAGRYFNLGRFRTRGEAEAVVRRVRENLHQAFANHGGVAHG